MKKLLIGLATIAAASVAIAQQKQQQPAEHLSIDRPVHSIDLPHFLPYLPPGDNRELFASRCLSCHATRYISMQPTMTQAKWEESVKKMIKTYGAPILEDEAPKIAAYIVEFQKAPPDPLAGTSQQSTELPALASGDVERGKQVYTTACASCHGADGKGVAPNAASLLPHAVDLTDGRFAPTAIQASIVHGVRGTAMPAFSLSNEDVSNVVAYVVQFAAKPQAAAAPQPAAKAMYDMACASCHGATGVGDGFNAPTLPRQPTNFHLRQPSAERAVSVITEGVPGTAMASWKSKFGDNERKMLADYVRSFYGQQ